jgi:membrane protein
MFMQAARLHLDHVVTKQVAGRSKTRRSPNAIQQTRLSDLARRVVKDIGEADMPGLAAEMAYHSMFALFAFLLMLAGLTAVADEILGIENMRQQLVDSANEVLPHNASAIIEAFLNDVVDSRGQGALMLGLIGVAWSGSNLVGAAMKGLNRIARSDETRGMIERKLLAITLALVLGTIVGCATLGVIFSGPLADGLTNVLGSRGAAEFFMTVVAWPAALMLVALAAAILYWKGPSRDGEFRWVTPGAVLFAGGWVAASVVASIYISQAGATNRTYGLITAVIAVIIWLHWSSLLFLAGAILNANLDDARTNGSSDDRAEAPAAAQP